MRTKIIYIPMLVITLIVSLLLWPFTAHAETYTISPDGNVYLANMGSTYVDVTHYHLHPNGGATTASEVNNQSSGCFNTVVRTYTCPGGGTVHYSHVVDYGTIPEIKDPVTGEVIQEEKHFARKIYKGTCNVCGGEVSTSRNESDPGDSDGDWVSCGATTTVYGPSCGKTASTVVARIHVYLNEVNGSIMMDLNDQGNSCNNQCNWTVKEMDIDGNLINTYTRNGVESYELPINQPKYQVTCTFTETCGTSHTYSTPVFIASIFNLRYQNELQKPIHVYLDGVKLRAVYYCGDGNTAAMFANSRDYLMYGY